MISHINFSHKLMSVISRKLLKSNLLTRRRIITPFPRKATHYACRQDNYCKSCFNRDDRPVAHRDEAVRVVTHAVTGSERLRYTRHEVALVCDLICYRSHASFAIASRTCVYSRCVYIFESLRKICESCEEYA